MTCRWQSRVSLQNCSAARHTEVNRSQHRETLLSDTSSEWSGLGRRDTLVWGGFRGRCGSQPARLGAPTCC